MIRIVSLIIINKEKKILLLKRSSHRKSYPNKWNFISGTIENELPIECANREIIEELGTEFKFKLINQGNSFIDKQEEYEWRVYPFVYQFISGKIKIDDEHSEYKWIYPNELSSYDIVPGTLEDLNHVNL